MVASLIFLFVSSQTFTIIGAEYIASSPRDQDANYCVLPPYPENGRYTVNNIPHATPGDRYSSVRLEISCNTGYLNKNTVKRILCVDGDWSASMPTCDRDDHGFCPLPTDDLKVEYRCLSFPGTLVKSWECESLVPPGTIVRPICRFPAYFSLKVLQEMHCSGGRWNYNPICQPERSHNLLACGLTTRHQQLEGTSGNHLELPWHAVIYENSSGSYNRACGGSLISATKIISIATRFCDSNNDYKLLPASNFMVAVNKMYLQYNDSRDRNSQYSHIVDTKIPSGFRGHTTFLEDNIAIVVIERPFFFHLSVSSVCLDFDNNLDRIQLTAGNSGKTVYWTKDDISNKSYVKNVVDFQYIEIEDCRINKLWKNQRQYLIDDKFCAVYIGAEKSNIRDFGGGLAFLEPTTQRYYLRGVLSIILGIVDEPVVNIHTSIVKHEHFIKQHL